MQSLHVSVEFWRQGEYCHRPITNKLSIYPQRDDSQIKSNPLVKGKKCFKKELRLLHGMQHVLNTCRWIYAQQRIVLYWYNTRIDLWDFFPNLASCQPQWQLTSGILSATMATNQYWHISLEGTTFGKIPKLVGTLPKVPYLILPGQEVKDLSRMTRIN